jgi:uncharacterized membrane protein YdcZ (DUF606 family)
MYISVGWFCLIGGVVGAFRVAIAKKFLRSDFANMEGVIAEADYKTEVHITPKKRWIIVGVCVVIAAFGVFRIQQDRKWNPFQSGGETAPTTVR